VEIWISDYDGGVENPKGKLEQEFESMDQ
jgi:hypothetical protein